MIPSHWWIISGPFWFAIVLEVVSALAATVEKRRFVKWARSSFREKYKSTGKYRISDKTIQDFFVVSSFSADSTRAFVPFLAAIFSVGLYAADGHLDEKQGIIITGVAIIVIIVSFVLLQIFLERFDPFRYDKNLRLFRRKRILQSGTGRNAVASNPGNSLARRVAAVFNGFTAVNLFNILVNLLLLAIVSFVLKG